MLKNVPKRLTPACLLVPCILMQYNRRYDIEGRRVSEPQRSTCILYMFLVTRSPQSEPKNLVGTTLVSQVDGGRLELPYQPVRSEGNTRQYTYIGVREHLQKLSLTHNKYIVLETSSHAPDSGRTDLSLTSYNYTCQCTPRLRYHKRCPT